MIDFGKLSAQLHKGKIINPTEIFMSLPEKSAKYAYLRNVQAEVLDQWFLQRDRKDNIIMKNKTATISYICGDFIIIHFFPLIPPSSANPQKTSWRCGSCCRCGSS